MRGKRTYIVMALALTIAAVVGARAQEKRAEADMEGQVRQAGFRYYAGMVFGDAEECLKATRLPLYTVRDGVGSHQDEKAIRALLTRTAERAKAFSDEERKQISGNMLAIFEEASVQFIGANTASLTFLVRPGRKEGEGDSLATLLLHRKEGRWLVIAEVTDSAPIPPDYLK